MAKEKNTPKTGNHDNKERVSIWLTPSMRSRMNGWLAQDNCKNETEFVEKALRFYMGYLSTDDTSEYLSKALVTTLRGIMADNGNRLRSLLFKWAVELNMAMHTVAAHFKVDDIDRRELRRFAVDEVKRTNGQISFDRALDIQRQIPDEDEWHE